MPESSKKTAKVKAVAVVPTPTKKGTEECINMSVVAAAAKKKEETSGDDYENSDVEDAAPFKTVQKPVTKKEDETSEESESESESESEEESDGDEPQKKKTKSQQAAARRAFLERFPPPKGSFKELFPASTTLYVVQVPYSTRRVDLEDFYKPAGKVVNYMFCKTISEHYCNAFVALDTPEAAKKALELNGQELLGSKIEFIMDSEYEEEDFRCEDYNVYDPLLGVSRDSYSREPLSGSVALFTGFSRLDGEAEIRSYVEKIFENSSEPPRVSIPKKKWQSYEVCLPSFSE